MRRRPGRLVIVSNRLPIVINRAADGDWRAEPGAGGLITALAPVMRQRGGLWIGWPAAPPGAPAGDLLAEVGREMGFDLAPVPLSEELVQGFYLGFSNEALWPLFHDMLDRCVFDRGNWAIYQAANRQFAETVLRVTHEDDLLWIHDYHLLLVAQQMRALGSRRRSLFFLHIPFPTPDLFRRLPWRRQILEAMLDYRLLGFQTAHDARNFVRCVRDMVPEARVTHRHGVSVIHHHGRVTLVDDFPIGIDFDEFNSLAQTPEAAAASREFRANLPHRTIVLGIDRLDYSKGIPSRFTAFENLLDRNPDYLGRISLVQIVVPSRTDVPEYQAWKRHLDELVGAINGRHYRGGWVPIHYSFRSMDRTELVGHYRAADIALVTPLRDGMNLVCKEYCASQVDETGVLILSEFAGAAVQLRAGALLVNPYDTEGVADALRQAHEMPRDERRRRMRRLRAEVRRHDVHRWAREFLASKH